MTKTIRRILYIGLAVASLSACAPQKQDADAGSKDPGTAAPQSVDDKIGDLVEKASRGQFKFGKKFEGPDGLIGLVLESSSGGNKIVAWTTANGEILLPGPAFDKTGENLSEKRLAEQAGFKKPEDLATEMAKTGFIAGKSGPIANVFFEPYCGYCGKVMKELKPLIEDGKVRVRFVMVGFLTENSVARAAEIAGAKDPYKALVEWESRSDKSNAPAPGKSDAAVMAKIAGHNKLIGEAGQVGTPAFVVCKTGGGVELVKGAPSDVAGFVAGISESGHPACKN